MISSGIKLSQNRFAVLSKDPDSDVKPLKKRKEKGEQNSSNHSQPKPNNKGNQSSKNSAAKQPQKQKKKDHFSKVKILIAIGAFRCGRAVVPNLSTTTDL